MNLASCVSVLKISQTLSLSSCKVCKTKFTIQFLKALYSLGLIYGFVENGKFGIIVFLRYDKNGVGLLKNLTLASTSSKNIYIKNSFSSFFSYSHYILVTSPRGIKVGCKANRVNYTFSGKVMCYV